MTWLLGGIAYGVVALVGARLIAGHLAWKMNDRARAMDAAMWPRIHQPEEFLSPSGERWAGAWCLALLAVSVWPLVAAAWLVGRDHAVGAEKAARIADREREVERLERELGL